METKHFPCDEPEEEHLSHASLEELVVLAELSERIARCPVGRVQHQSEVYQHELKKQTQTTEHTSPNCPPGSPPCETRSLSPNLASEISEGRISIRASTKALRTHLGNGAPYQAGSQSHHHRPKGPSVSLSRQDWCEE